MTLGRLMCFLFSKRYGPKNLNRLNRINRPPNTFKNTLTRPLRGETRRSPYGCHCWVHDQLDIQGLRTKEKGPTKNSIHPYSRTAYVVPGRSLGREPKMDYVHWGESYYHCDNIRWVISL